MLVCLSLPCDRLANRTPCDCWGRLQPTCGPEQDKRKRINGNLSKAVVEMNSVLLENYWNFTVLYLSIWMLQKKLYKHGQIPSSYDPQCKVAKNQHIPKAWSATHWKKLAHFETIHEKRSPKLEDRVDFGAGGVSMNTDSHGNSTLLATVTTWSHHMSQTSSC